MAEVYALVCPDTGNFRYIGMTTKSAARRFRHHLSADALGPVRDWVSELRAAGKRPILRVIAKEITKSTALILERALIYRTKNLLNRTQERPTPEPRYDKYGPPPYPYSITIAGLDTLSWWKHRRKQDGLI